ncbi:uncharacterized protein PHACADRAFT_202580 [Phanerochaete carnosa HHB-10118-sp]|uniref:Uncharacterized protein n=1 Tax=Phanerochaete carnosa (strain HHB-10118-sp) TaxID=650164 RepID=K5UGM6_PHACS|nr:uncharacterized protein PHACADRAFT_202580 [Phanerochaete carnosa HHB-10118-sp]EKM48631.1 hypothetical protein PHACADRAFT_202580 [Phanerochaete carnosa HHB-10118-sp]
MTLSRSRLTGTNLMNSTELSLHIMQEYESGGALATCLQRRERHFIDCAAAPPPTITPTVHVPLANVPIAASVTLLAAGSAFSGTASASGPSLVFQPGASSPGPITVPMTGQPKASPIGSTGQASSETQPNERAPNAPFMQDIALAMARAAESAIQAELLSTVMSQCHGQPLHCRLDDLFDFRNTYWTDTMDKLGLRGLEEEMEVHGLFDLDAEGEEDCEELRACT